MAPQQRYLSTDPNTGEPLSPPRGYLSTDPAAGQPLPSVPATNRLGSVDLPPDVQAQWDAMQRGQTSGGDVLLDNLRAAVSHLPNIGGAIGGFVGAVPGVRTLSAGIGGATGEAYRQAIEAGKTLMTGEAPRNLPNSLTGQFKAMGAAGAKQAAYQGVGETVGAGMAKAGPWLMEKAVKPTQSVVDEYRTTAPKIVQTLLDEGVSVTQSGLEKLQKLFGETNDAISNAVVQSPADISKSAVASYVPELSSKLANQVNPISDLAAVNDVTSEFMKHPAYPGESMPVAAAQAMKKGTYQQIGKKYGEVSSANIEAQKALGRGLKDQIARAVPGISALNAKDSELMAAMDAVGRRVAVAGRADPVGFAWVAHNPTTFLAALIDRNPTVKSLLARGMYQSASVAAGVTPQLLRVAVTAIAQGQDEGGGSPARPTNQSGQ